MSYTAHPLGRSPLTPCGKLWTVAEVLHGWEHEIQGSLTLGSPDANLEEESYKEKDVISIYQKFRLLNPMILQQSSKLWITDYWERILKLPDI